jgi:peptide/nickel transport system permease protein
VVAVPIGIYSATHQYSLFDYSVTVVGFVGLATPNFLLALVLMIVFNNAFGISIGGLFSAEYSTAPWSLGKVWDMIKHLPVPIIVLGTAGTAGVIRVMRGMLLDELRKQYVITARAKGVGERSLLFKYPVRIAVNPIVSTVGWLLPVIVSGETITALVLSLPTTGPLLLRALLAQDMYLAATIVIFLTVLTVIGTLLSDLLLAWLDPRIRFDASASA